MKKILIAYIVFASVNIAFSMENQENMQTTQSSQEMEILRTDDLLDITKRISQFLNQVGNSVNEYKPVVDGFLDKINGNINRFSDPELMNQVTNVLIQINDKINTIQNSDEAEQLKVRIKQVEGDLKNIIQRAKEELERNQRRLEDEAARIKEEIEKNRKHLENEAKILRDAAEKLHNDQLKPALNTIKDTLKRFRW